MCLIPLGRSARPLPLVAAFACGLAAIAQAQVAPSLPPPPGRAELGMTIDLEALLTAQDVFGASMGDAVWTITPQPGRRLIQVPMIFERPEQDIEVGPPTVDLRGGRFLAWKINPDEPDPGEAAQFGRAGPPPGSMGPPPGMATADARNIEQLLLMNGNNFDLAGQRPAQTDPQRQAINAAAAVVAGELPPGAPQLTRKLVVKADGGLGWDLERAVPNGTVGEASNFGPQGASGAPSYALKIRPELLAGLEPQRAGVQRQQAPAPRAPGEPIQRVDPAAARAAAAQRRESEAQYREQIEAYRELRTAVRELPEHFEVEMPRRVWAIYEVPESTPALSFGGDQPWIIRTDSLETLRAVAGAGRGGGGALDATSMQRVSAMGFMVADKDPMTFRAVAMALDRAGWIGEAQINDPLYQLLQAIIGGPDDRARNIVVKRLATTLPTAATAALLRDAARHMTPELQLLSLQGLMRGDVNDPNQLRDMLANTNRALADAKGPDAGLILKAMAENAGATGPNGRPQAANGGPNPQLVNGIEFERIPPSRRDSAIAYIIRGAGTQPLAAAWLNNRLLGSPDQNMVRRTLELLADAQLPGQMLRPVSSGLVRLVFGEPEEAAQTKLDLTLSAPIPIDSTAHSLFRGGLYSGDAGIRALAWEALPKFTLQAAAGSGYGQPSEAPAANEVVAQLMQAGLGQEPTPVELAMFLSRQRNERATAGLVELVLFADDNAAKRAARSLIGGGLDVTEAVASRQADQRAEFAGKLYHYLRGRRPLVVGLLAEPTPRHALISWFAGELASGHLPDAVEWANAYGTEQELIQAAASADQAYAAGGVAGLVASAGGDEAAAAELAQRFAAEKSRTPQTLTAAWSNAKKDIYSRRLAEAAGSYRLMVRLYGDPSATPDAEGMPAGPPPGAFGPNGPPPGYMGPPPGYGPPPGFGMDEESEDGERQPTKSITLGVVDLKVQGQQVSLGDSTLNLSIPPDMLAMRIAKGTDLRNFKNDELQQVPLDRLVRPLDLTPREDGSWRARDAFPDGTEVEVVLEPVK